MCRVGTSSRNWRRHWGGRVGTSRGAVEAGLAPRALQVGQTGTPYTPSFTLHVAYLERSDTRSGMRTARTVVAMNRDPDAFIFRLADFGIVADVRDALPQLAAALHRSGARRGWGSHMSARR